MPVGIQLTVIGSAGDAAFTGPRDILLKDPKRLKKYNSLKRQFQGRHMNEYRKAKSKFLAKIMKMKSSK